MKCYWCEEESVNMIKSSVFWELPDGLRAIEIKETPTCLCTTCHMQYQEEELTKQLEDQLYLVNFKKLPDSLTFEELMKTPKILKKNYFDFSS